MLFAQAQSKPTASTNPVAASPAPLETLSEVMPEPGVGGRDWQETERLRRDAKSSLSVASCNKVSGSRIFSCILALNTALAMGKESRSHLHRLLPCLHSLSDENHIGAGYFCAGNCRLLNCLHGACGACSLPPESICQAEVPPQPPLFRGKKQHKEGFVFSARPGWARFISDSVFPRVRIISCMRKMGFREDASASPWLSPAPPVAACQAFILIEMQGWLLQPSAELSAPGGTFPSFPSSSRGCLWSYSSASAFHNSSKADASILSGDGDVRRIARGLQAGVGRFPAISLALSPSLASSWLVPKAWTKAWGRDGEGKRMRREGTGIC